MELSGAWVPVLSISHNVESLMRFHWHNDRGLAECHQVHFSANKAQPVYLFDSSLSHYHRSTLVRAELIKKSLMRFYEVNLFSFASSGKRSIDSAISKPYANLYVLYRFLLLYDPIVCFVLHVRSYTNANCKSNRIEPNHVVLVSRSRISRTKHCSTRNPICWQLFLCKLFTSLFESSLRFTRLQKKKKNNNESRLFRVSYLLIRTLWALMQTRARPHRDRSSDQRERLICTTISRRRKNVRSATQSSMATCVNKEIKIWNRFPPLCLSTNK